MPVAVTGAGGYIGSRLLGVLPESSIGLVHKRVHYVPQDRQVEVDLVGDPAALAEALQGATTVVHLAGHNEIVAAQEPDRALAETIVGTRRVCAAAVQAGVRRIVYLSTVHVYGAQLSDDAVVDENVVPQPRSTYAIARLTSEHLVHQAALEGLDAVVLRLTNAVGAPADAAVDRWSLVANDLCRQAVREGRLVLRSPGTQWRDFVALRDVCAIIAGCTDLQRVPAGTYNLGLGRSMTVRQLAELIQDRVEAFTGQRPPLEAPAPEGRTPRAYRVVVDRLSRYGCTPTTPMSDAVDELIELVSAESRKRSESVL